jgi:hypothetical protein
MISLLRPLIRRLAPLFLAAGLLVAPATTHPVRAQVPDPSDTSAPGEEGKGSGRPFDGYIATLALIFLVFFIVGKSARR